MVSDRLPSRFVILRILFGSSTDSRIVFLRIALCFALFHAIGILVTATDGTAILAKGGLGYLQDPGSYALFLSFVFSFYFLFLLHKRFLLAFSSNPDSPSAYPDIFNAMKHDESFRKVFSEMVDGKIKIVALETRTTRVLYWSLVGIIFVLFCLTSVILPLQNFQDKQVWAFLWNSSYAGEVPRTHYFATYLYNQIKDCILYVFIMPTMLWQIVTIAWGSNRIVRYIQTSNRFAINPLAPDGAGGLKPLGELSLLLFYILFAQFIHVVMIGFLLGYPISHQILYPLFLLLSAYVFFAPLKSAHRSMQSAKLAEMNRLSQLFTLRYEQHKIDTEKSSTAVGPHNILIELTSLKELYKEAEKLPVWPYDLGTISKFLSLFVIPFVIALVQALVSLGVTDFWKNLMGLFGVLADK